MAVDPSIEAAIRQAAEEAGEDPAYALAVAERESRFNPRAKASKSMRGMFQMSGALRSKYGIGDSEDALDQARGFYRFLPDLRGEMKSILGRDPTHEELYLGHHYGGKRAARTMKMDPNMPVEGIFTAREMGENPHFARAGTIGNLNASVMGDVSKRMARFGGAATSPAAAEPADLSSFGDAVGDASTTAGDASTAALPKAVVGGVAPTTVDLSSFGEVVDVSPMLGARETATSAAGSVPYAPRAADLSSFGTPV